MKLKRAIAAAVFLLLSGCHYPNNTPPQILSRDANSIDIRSGVAIDSDNLAVLHCQYYGKLMVPNGVEQVRADVVVRHYLCR